jgi:hypothetical protein
MLRRASQLFAVLGLIAGMIACGGGGGSKPIVSIAISAPASTVTTSATLQFTAIVSGSSNTAVTWEVNGVAGGAVSTGKISSSGLYTAPAAVPSPATVTVTGVSQADGTKTSSLTITITSGGGAVTVTVTPSGNINVPFNVETFATQTFSASVTGTSNTAVTWSISCQVGGSACGAISSAGKYVAPNSVPTLSQSDGSVVNDTVTVTATSVASPSSTGNSIVYVKPLNQNALSAPISMGSSGSSVGATCLSGGQGFCFGGTLGSLLTRGGTQFIMSNNHVLGLSDGATAGQAITQPGEIETNCETAGTITVANFTSFVSLQPQPTTAVDVAIAQVISGEVDTTGKVLEFGAVSGGIPQPGEVVSGSGMAATVGQALAKSGRTTGLTCASVEAISLAVEVSYSKGCSTTTSFNVHYVNQIALGSQSNGDNFIAEGDSGSLAVDEATATPVALMFAGDSDSSVGNPVSAVLSALQSGSNAATFVGTGTPHAIAACSLAAPAADGIVGKGANARVATASLSAAVTQAALGQQDRNAAQLMNVEGVSAVGTGASLDSPGQAALLVFLPAGASTTSIPAEVNGVRTRIVESGTALRGSLSQTQTAQLATAQLSAPAISLTGAPIENAIAIKDQHVADLMSHESVKGVGVSASLDAPGDPAIIIYIMKGASRDFIPASIDGVRTRIKETTGFKAGVSRPVHPKSCALANATISHKK